jgi:hypothetical protein
MCEHITWIQQRKKTILVRINILTKAYILCLNVSILTVLGRTRFLELMFRIVFWDVLMMEAVRTSETSVDNYFTRQYIPEDNSEHHTRRREKFKSHMGFSTCPSSYVQKTHYFSIWTIDEIQKPGSKFICYEICTLDRFSKIYIYIYQFLEYRHLDTFNTLK